MIRDFIIIDFIKELLEVDAITMYPFVLLMIRYFIIL